VKDWVVLIACALIGWGVVSWLMAVIRPRGTNAVPTSPATPTNMEVDWPGILQVDSNATVPEIESAYHRLLAECDRVRFSSWHSAEERREAEMRRNQICAAYEFIRPRR
jgi:preprotein translocase subunit Sec63